jgi:methyl-accepting chemotaxis protein
MDQAAGAYMRNCNDFLAGQNENMKKEIDAGAAHATFERLAKITLVNDIVDLGNDVRVKNFKSQATWDPALIESA